MEAAGAALLLVLLLVAVGLAFSRWIDTTIEQLFEDLW